MRHLGTVIVILSLAFLAIVVYVTYKAPVATPNNFCWEGIEYQKLSTNNQTLIQETGRECQ